MPTSTDGLDEEDFPNRLRHGLNSLAVRIDHELPIFLVKSLLFGASKISSTVSMAGTA